MNIIKNFMLIALLSLTHFVIASGAKDDFNITEVAQGNYLHIGVHVSIDDIKHDDIANIGFIVGDKCIAVIDTGGSIDIGMELLKKIKSISDKPICYVINTHVHFDHMLGNKAFVLENPEFVGHQQLAAEVEQNREFFLEQFKNDLGSNPDPSSIVGPNILIDKSSQLDLGDRILTLVPFPVSHSRSDLIIIDKKTNTLWAGDLIFRERIPSLTGSLIGWVKVMEDLLRLEVKLVIPGHGNVADSIPIAIKQQREYLQRLLAETRQAIEEGQFVNEAAENIDKDNLSNWLLHDYQHPTNVSRAFTELEWE
ncbi:MAG: MBL fold metallo-hydrolase [Thermodesulfobacteriota bacterium]|nr:MAG: MBL fold metallo-hydrolase [Thermodesulfobacteriota bacterium]